MCLTIDIYLINVLLQSLKITLGLEAIYTTRTSGIEVYLYTRGNIIIPRKSSGVYGSKFINYNRPKENTSYYEKLFVYKNVIRTHASTSLGCTNNMVEDPVGRCVVRRIEEKKNCTTYQIFANKRKEICNRTQEFESRKMHNFLADLPEEEIYELYGCVQHCEHEEIDVKTIGQPLEYHSKRPTFTLEFQFEDGSYHKTEDYIVYDSDSFIADVGGYLGLLLGHSMLSLYSSLVGWLSNSKSKICY